MEQKPSKHNRTTEVIPNRAKELREILQLTQEQFAESIMVSTNTISRIERREISLTAENAVKIADRYHISLDWLYLRSDTMESPRYQKNLQEALQCIEESAKEARTVHLHLQKK